MKVSADYDTCAGHGQCLLAAPTVFDLPDDADQVVILDPNPGDSLRQQVNRAIGVCPVSALSVTD